MLASLSAWFQCALSYLGETSHVKATRSTVLTLCMLALLASPAQSQTVIYVNDDAPAGGSGSSWATAYQDLQAALSAAEAVPSAQRNVEIWLAAGTYVPTRLREPGVARSASFIVPRGVALLGGFAGTEATRFPRLPRENRTVLSGDISQNDTAAFGNRGDNVFRVVLIDADGGNARLDGLTVRGGNADGPQGPLDNNFLYVDRANGAGIAIRAGTVTIVGCEVTDNFATFNGAGINVSTRSLSVIVNIQSTIIAANTSIYGAAIASGVGNVVVTVTNCTIVNNAGNSPSNLGGSIVYPDQSTMVIRNSILWENRHNANTTMTQNQFFTAAGNTSGGVTRLSNCLLQMNVSTTARITENVSPMYFAPMFTSIGGTNYALASGSPGIDAGSAAFTQFARDFLFNRRVQNTVDIGAVEANSVPFTPLVYVRQGLTTGQNDGSSWSNAFRGPLGLRDALAYVAAVPVGETDAVWVAAGTYTPSAPMNLGGSRSASFNLQNNLAIYGGFQGNETLLTQRNIAANPTILSGDLNNDDPQGPNRNENSFSVVTANQLNPSAVLDGVTVTRGNAKDSPSNQGGGILIIGGGGSGPLWKQGPLFRNLTVRENYSDTGSGGGVSAQSAGRAQFEQTRFVFNGSSGFGGAVAQSANSHVGYIDCQFERNSCNTQSGGAMYIAGGAVAYLRNCSFVKNRGWTAGGAIHVHNNNSRLIADGCTFYGNTALAGSGGALFLQDTDSSQDNPANPKVEVRNSIFVGNTARGAGADGAAIKSGLSFSVFTNCTIVANESATGAAVQLNYRGVSFLNCFLYGNTSRDNSTSGEAAQTSSGFGGARNIQHSTVQGWSGSLGGANNNGLDPIFIRYPSKGLNNEWDTNDSPAPYDDDYGDLRLSSNSPAIDSGDSLAVPPDTYDIDADGNTTEALPLDLAGQPRFYDDPTRANTGNGNPPVDRGAYENNLATTTWASPFGGRFDFASNWAGGVPNSTVRAIFDDSIGLNRAYTVTIPTNQSAYSLSVLANELNINLRGLTTSGNLTLAGPGTDQNAPTVLVSGPAGVPTGLAVTNTGNTPRTVFAGNGVVAASTGSAANLRVDGSRASLQFANTLDLGLAGSAQVSVINRGWLGASSLRAGVNPGSSASITVAGIPGLGDSLLSLAGPGADEVILASRGTATLTATNQALIAGLDELDRVVFAEHPGSVATLSLSGLGTLWDTSQSDLIIAKAGTANISITDGAQLTTATANRLVLAEQPGSVANITIGPGSNWTELLQSVVLAGEGQATITMLPGSSLNFQSNLVINPAGTIQGSGTISGGVFNVGTVRVGNSPGTLTINGSFRQLAGQSDPDPARRNRAGQLEMEVQGLAPNQYDRLIINPGVGGTAELGGGLIVRLAQGIDIADNTQLPIITGPRGVTRFDAALLPSLPNNRFARVIYGAGSNSPVSLGVQPLQPPYNPEAPEGAAVAGTPSAVIAADFNNDGFPDLATTVPDTTAGQPGAVFVLLNAGVQAGNWLGFPTVDVLQLGAGIDPQDIDAADMDGDGFKEIVVANRGSDNVVIYKNAAGSAFTAQTPIATGNAPISVSAAVFFDSGTSTQLPDLLVANELDETVQLYRSNDAPASPVLSPRPAVIVPGRPIRTRPGQLDNDKRRVSEAVALVQQSDTSNSVDAVIPLVLSGPDGPNANFVRLPSIPVPERPRDLICQNFNSVPTDDVIVINASGTISVLRNRTAIAGAIGTEPFAPAVNLPIPGVGVDLAAVDVDGDADFDLAIVTAQSTSPSAARDVYTLRNLQDESTMISLAEPNSLNAAGQQPVLVVGTNVQGNADAQDVEEVIYLGVPPECPNCLTTPQNVFTRPVPFVPPCDSLDFNRDGLFPDDADLLDLLSVISGGPCSTAAPFGNGCSDIDFNNDGFFPDDTDLLAYLRVAAGGGC